MFTVFITLKYCKHVLFSPNIFMKNNVIVPWSEHTSYRWFQCRYLSFSVIGIRFYRFCRFYRIMRELKKSKILPPLGREPRHWHLWLSSPACYPSAISPVCWKSQLFRSLCSHAVLMQSCCIDPKKFLSPRINWAWLHKDLKGWDVQHTGERSEG